MIEIVSKLLSRKWSWAADYVIYVCAVHQMSWKLWRWSRLSVVIYRLLLFIILTFTLFLRPAWLGVICVLVVIELMYISGCRCDYSKPSGYLPIKSM